jgi:hypothetical protein
MHSEDQVQAVTQADKASGKFELDENGYTRFIPSKAELEAINSWLGAEIAAALEDHKPVFAEAAENLETYKAVKTVIADSGETILPSPIARIPADQIIAWTFNTVMRPKPIFSVDAYFPAEYPVAVPVKMPDPLTGQEVTVAVPTPVDAERVAQRLEQGLDFKMRERLGFSNFALRIITDAVTGATPAWGKVCRKLTTRPIVAPKSKGAYLDLANKEERYVRSGEEIHFYAIPTFNVLMPMDEDDPNESPWLAERTPLPPEEASGKVMMGDWFLVSEDDGKKLAALTSDVREEIAVDIAATTQNRVTALPRPKCDVWEVWFYRYIKFNDLETGRTTVRRVSLMGEYHLTAKRLVSCFKNPYDHQQRIHVPFWQIKDPHSHAGSSTVGILKWHQKIATHLMQAEIKNAFHANNLLYWYDEDSRVADFFGPGKKKVAPGDMVPGKEGEEWGVVRAGAQHYSLLPLQQWVASQAQMTSNVSSYESGDNIPGRTPAATVAQILEQGRQQPIMFLRTLNESFTTLVRLYLETVRQFQPMGETIPVRDPETKQLIEVPFRFPVGEVLDNFRISLTASDEAMAKEHELEQLTMLKNLLMQDANFVAQVAGPMINPEATAGQVELFKKMLEANSVLTRQIMSLTRTDEEKFDYSEAINAIVEEHKQAAAMLQQQQEAERMMANAQSQTPDSGGAVPGPGAQPDSGGPVGTGAEPPLSEIPPDVEAAGVPAM